MNTINNYYNNYNNYTASFKGIKKGAPTVENSEEKMKNIANKAMEILSDSSEREVPENGKFIKVAVLCSVPGTQNEAKITVEHDLLEPNNSRRLSVNVHRKGSDRFVTSYVSKGTKKEILEYLKDEKNAIEIANTALELSKDVDKYYSEI